MGVLKNKVNSVGKIAAQTDVDLCGFLDTLLRNHLQNQIKSVSNCPAASDLTCYLSNLA